MNRTKYARHRSIMKGTRHQLGEVLNELKKARYYQEYSGVQGLKDFCREWTFMTGQCIPIRVPLYLRSGVNRIWPDVMQLIAKEGKRDTVLIAIACFPDAIDIIVSKWGTGDGLRNNTHHFYHWHVKADYKKVDGFPSVDDFIASMNPPDQGQHSYSGLYDNSGQGRLSSSGDDYTDKRNYV